MADIKRRLAQNAAGDFFVDATCIDCGTCRHVAPDTFAEGSDYSYVFQQPAAASPPIVNKAIQALLACPTGSIGVENNLLQNDIKARQQDFPLLIEEPVYYCGFTSAKSYGASSYFVKHADGNWLIDSPKFLPKLIERFSEWGGIRYIFLTHSDDVAEADRYAAHFQATRIIHRKEAWSQPDAELLIESDETPVEITPGFTVIPTPGHTQGHCVLHVANRFLFTGDHLWWEPSHEKLGQPVSLIWNQEALLRSNQRLSAFEFEWLLPGHGAPIHLPREQMCQAMASLNRHTN